MSVHILKISCPSKRGIVAAVSSYLAENGCSIYDSSQFDDTETAKFFMRVSFVSEEGKSFDEVANNFFPTAQKWQMDFAFHPAGYRMKVIIMVSRFGHCLNDILYRWKIGMLPIDIVAIVSNHRDHEQLVQASGLPLH